MERQGSGGSRNAGRAQNRRTRVPKGNPRDREVPESRKALEEARAGLLGWQQPRGCRVGARVPSLQLTLAASERQGETARAQRVLNSGGIP